MTSASDDRRSANRGSGSRSRYEVKLPSMTTAPPSSSEIRCQTVVDFQRPTAPS